MEIFSDKLVLVQCLQDVLVVLEGGDEVGWCWEIDVLVVLCMQLMMVGLNWFVCEFGQVLGELFSLFSEVGELDDVCVCLDYVVVMIEQVIYCILDLVEECCVLIE